MAFGGGDPLDSYELRLCLARCLFTWSSPCSKVLRFSQDENVGILMVEWLADDWKGARFTELRVLYLKTRTIIRSDMELPPEISRHILAALGKSKRYRYPEHFAPENRVSHPKMSSESTINVRSFSLAWWNEIRIVDSPPPFNQWLGIWFPLSRWDR